MRNSTEYDLDSATWYRSSYSGGSGGNCLEVSDGHPTITPVRDSKHPHGPHLLFPTETWAAFIDDLKQA
ncbi:DUF397 domain-containing protein [Streptomyces roseirectus]|uniref:DUF397 domain-containing protein n=1 Tax=Streptomyces roseirectus TaxID=2768066 RepID=A0A7H0IGP4_9ACTN|nr:DUF397 domain-containing protein [Streptomyces roseirectus]QNP71960.1 DUF397 domain-containing protein [Streptomyces roseirectus]